MTDAGGGNKNYFMAGLQKRMHDHVIRFMDVPNGYGYGFIDCEETKLRFSRAPWAAKLRCFI